MDFPFVEITIVYKITGLKKRLFMIGAVREKNARRPTRHVPHDFCCGFHCADRKSLPRISRQATGADDRRRSRREIRRILHPR